MKLGIRIMPTPDCVEMLVKLSPSVVEIRYDPAEAASYNLLIDYLKSSYQADIGMSLRGMLNSGELPNIAYPDESLNAQSIAHITHGLTMAQMLGCKYVNIYPGTRTRIVRDKDTRTLIVTTEAASVESAATTFLDAAEKLSKLAQQKGLLLTFETVPPHAIHDHATLEPSPTEVFGYNLPVEVLERGATRHNLLISNNLTHTAANLPHGRREEMWEFLRAKTRLMAPWTKIIYIGSQHLSSMPQELQNQHIFMPNRMQLGELLRTFSGRDDIWVFPEVQIHQERAYQNTAELLSRLGLYYT